MVYSLALDTVREYIHKFAVKNILNSQHAAFFEMLIAEANYYLPLEGSLHLSVY